MRELSDRAGLSLALVAAVVLLLPLLAVLQYRWIGQVSEAERERMQANLRTATARFSQEFNGELARALMAFQMGRPVPPPRELEEYAERYARWSETTPYRELIQNFYLTKDSELLILNRASGSFERVEWPPQLAAVRADLESRSQNGLRPGMPLLPRVVDADVPALVAPRFLAPPPGLPRPDQGRPDWPRPGQGRSDQAWSGQRRTDWPRPRRAPLAGWSIAELNLTFIQKEFLPELVQRHFGQAGGEDYQLLIVRRAEPGQVIYRSDTRLSEANFSSPDATASLLDVRPDPAARGWGWNAMPGRLPRPGGAPPLGREPGGGRWQLMVKHRLGSLETAVAKARHRNLLISFAVLLLLAASIGMLVVLTQRAQRLAKLQMEFVAGVSHELRTPLTVIWSAGDNLADGLVANGPQVQRYGAVIRNEGRRLSEMVEQILAFAGAQAGRMKFDLQPVEIAGIVDRALAACETALRETGCQIEKHVEPDLPLVMADATSLTHCVRNLLSNALKYGKEGKWIGVSARMNAAQKGAAVQIRVEDKGPGIEPADLPHIFEPFYRGQKPIAAQIHGAGLGLSLVKRIIEAHAGAVTVTSRPGLGSCFTLSLPVRPSNGA